MKKKFKKGSLEPINTAHLSQDCYLNARSLNIYK